MVGYLALRNLYRQKQRYALVGVAVAVGFALITIITGAAYGALETVKNKAARYFAGHVSVTGFAPGGSQMIVDPGAVLDVIADSNLPIRTSAQRTIYYRGDATIFFGGERIRQRKLVGIDFSAEGKEFSGLTFNAGGWEAMTGIEGENGILVSTSAARLLGCRVGDDLMLYLTTDTGQYNTETLIVRGIFTETSLFGYVAYMRAEDLNRLTRRAIGAATDIAIYAKDGVDLRRLSEDVRLLLAQHFSVFPSFSSREARDTELGKGVSKDVLAVLSIDAQLAQITQLLDALLAVTYFVLVLFILIVMIGILNTYRVLVHERTREIGAMRSLGMQRSSVTNLFLLEAASLAISASIGGLVVGSITLRLLTCLDLSFLPGAGMFLDGGRLRFFLDARIVFLNALLMMGAALLAAIGPARRAGRIRPADALRHSG